MRAGNPLKAIQVWDIAVGKELAELGPYSIGEAVRTALSADGHYAATATSSGDVIWDTRSGQAITSFHGSSRSDLEDLEVMAFPPSVTFCGSGITVYPRS